MLFKKFLIFGVVLSTILSSSFNISEISKIEDDNKVDIGPSYVTPYDTFAPVGTDKWIKYEDGRWWYKHSDGTFTRSDWEKIANKWYYFDSDGWMLYGWQKINDKWYYLGGADDGAMKTGWQEISGNWYYFGGADEGYMRTGWELISNKWYYFGSVNDGSMKTNWQRIANKYYYFLSNGEMNTKDFDEGQRRYSFNSSGQLSRTVMNITRQEQQMSNWCWAASSVMIGSYDANSGITQSDVVKKIKGYLVNDGGDHNEIGRAINYVSYGLKAPKHIKPYKNYDEVVNYFDNNKLMGLLIKWVDRNAGHMIVGAGYDTVGDKIYCVDPGKNVENKFYNYKNLLGVTLVSTGVGSCIGLIVY